jgi:NADP-dependent 3-hydroxy acid dehydrogenase YdfG
MTGNLTGRVALVTGASSGIGSATAVLLAKHGAAVALAARREDRLEEMAARIAAEGGKAIVLAGDICDELVASRTVESTVKRFGGIDILVNAAGIIRAGGATDLPAEEWRRLIDVNLMATVFCCRAAIGAMKAGGRGDIVNISSLAGRRAMAAVSAYSASKFAVGAFTESLRQELAKAGIRVTAIEPGQTETELGEGLFVGGPTAEASQRPGLMAGAMQADDVAQAIHFAISLPTRASVSQLLIRPTVDTAPL